MIELQTTILQHLKKEKKDLVKLKTIETSIPKLINIFWHIIYLYILKGKC